MAELEPDQVVDVWDAMGVLHITRDMTWARAKAAYRESAMVAHPDRGGDGEVFRLVTNAWAAVEPYQAGDQLAVPAKPDTTAGPPPTRQTDTRQADTRGTGTQKRRRWWQPEVYTGPPPRRARALTPGCGHVESSMGWRKRDDHHHGPEVLLDGVSSAGR